MPNLTGRFRFRISLFGKLVLQVEYEKKHYDHDSGNGYDIYHEDEYYTRHWRDAKESDVSAIEACTLVFEAPLVTSSSQV